MGLLNHPSMTRATNASGDPEARARLHICPAGKDFLVRIYRDRDLTYTQANPITADSEGYFALCFLPEGLYDIRIVSEYGHELTVTNGIAVTSDVGSVAGGETFSTVAELIAHPDVTYGSHPTGTGIKVSRFGFEYEVAASEATDHHLTTNIGVKLYALPDKRGCVSARQIGIGDGENGTAKFTQFLASRLTGISRLVCDVDFNLASPSNAGFSAPKTITLEADNADVLSHGEHATRKIGLMNLIDERATPNSLTRMQCMFDATSIRARGLLFDHDVAVDEGDVTDGGNGAAVFRATDGSGATIEKCRADMLSSPLLELYGHQHWRVDGCWAGKQVFFVNVNWRSDYGVFTNNSGDMGFATDSNVFGDYIKSGAGMDGRAPRFCRVTDNRFINRLRDGIDATGGMHGWEVTNNYFRCAIAAIDVKQQPNAANVVDNLEENFKAFVIANNVFHGSEIVVTNNYHLTLYGSTPPDWILAQGITSSGNTFIPRPGKEECGFFLKSVQGLQSVGDNFSASRLYPAGDFDPTGGTFPADAVDGTYYMATGSATIDGLAITSGDLVVPKLDDASTTDSADWVIKETPWLACVPLRMGAGSLNGFSNQGSWDASGGTFPTSTVDGQYWTVSVAGKVDNIRFEVGDYITSLVDTASTTAYDGNWRRGRITYYPSNRDIVFRAARWEARSDVRIDLQFCERVSLEFAQCMTDHEKTIDVRSSTRDISLTGQFDSLPNEGNPAKNIEPIYINGGNKVRLDIKATHHGSDGRQDFIRHLAGNPEIWIDGTFCNVRAAIRSQQDCVMNIGTRDGLYLEDSDWLLVRTSETHNIRKGVLEYTDDISGLSNTQTNLIGNLYSVGTGQGDTLTISGGAVTARYQVHLVDTQSAAASDDLNTINGGAFGDVLTLRAADAARETVVKTGTGNIFLSGDRTLGSAAAFLTLRRGPTGWHEVLFDAGS